MSYHVAVLMGGWSSEREVSLSSGAGVVKALQDKGCKVTAVDVQRDLESLLRALTPRPDVIFNALHGKGGEDGTIQGVLDFLNVPYTHSGVLASAVAMNKPLTKLMVSREGIPVAKEVIAHRSEVMSRDVLPVPYVVKPIDEGSSVGVRIINEGSNYRILAEDSWIYGNTVMVEEFIKGRDLTVGVVGGKALDVTELISFTGFDDYTAKYTPGMGKHICPAQIPEDVSKAAMHYAEQAHLLLGLQSISRTDFRWDDSKPGATGLVFLEINTQPGFTGVSRLPEQAALHGQSYADLCLWMIEDALTRHRNTLKAEEVAA
jgi:D-alanine-D-alanine ligase